MVKSWWQLRIVGTELKKQRNSRNSHLGANVDIKYCGSTNGNKMGTLIKLASRSSRVGFLGQFAPRC